MDDRYAGKPFLRFVECFVLWSIGELKPKDQALLEQMTPKLRSTFAIEGTWQEIVEKHMGFSPSLPEALRGLWARNLERFQANRETPDPEHFARLVVDENLKLT